MKHLNLPNHPDVLMLYQDHATVEPAIQQIMELELEFKTYKFNPNMLHHIAEMKPKVVLLSSNSVKSTIRLYIDYLEEYDQTIAPHSAILLISNREIPYAYLACENGLFDNYAIINPLNDPFRLKLVLLKELEIIKNHKSNGLEQLMSDGEDELASCIEHGVALKNSFINEVKKCGENILIASENISENTDAKTVLQKLIGLSIEEMNDNVTSDIQGILDQLLQLKLNAQSIKQNIEQNESPKAKAIIGVNGDLLSSNSDNNPPQTLSYKVLIAEPSDLFTRAIEQIFDKTAFKYLLVNNGKSALAQIEIFKPDVALLAYDLPIFTGLEVTRLTREKGNDIPIIAYTHQRDKSMIKNWIPLGLSSYLIKPSKKSTILKSIDEAVKNPIHIIHHNRDADKSDIKWIPAYSVGNSVLDEQHKSLFEMVNEFFHKEGNKQEAIALFHNLSSYIDLHFEAEENLLRQINYPNTDEHVSKHNALREKFDAIQAKLNDYDTDVHYKIAMFLYNWLTKHILKSDMEYKKYAQSIEEESFSK